MIPIVHRSIEHKLDIPKEFVPSRLDQAVAELLPQYSRALIQQWIKQGALLVDEKSVKASLLSLIFHPLKAPPALSIAE